MNVAFAAGNAAALRDLVASMDSAMLHRTTSLLVRSQASCQVLLPTRILVSLTELIWTHMVRLLVTVQVWH